MLSFDDITKNLSSLQFDSALPDEERYKDMLIPLENVLITFKDKVFHLLGEP